MKTAKEILEHLLAPFNNKISKHRCLKKLKSLLPKNYQKYIKNIFLKGEVLYFYVSHPAIKFELYLKKDMIFNLIKTLHNLNQCKELNPKKIVTYYKYQQQTIPKDIKFYLKNAKDFEIKAKDKEIKEKFEEIRALIRAQK